jgi:hypothetical protein
MASVTLEPAEHLKALNTALKNSDFRDKLTAAIQYAAMFVSAGEAGNAKKVQVSVAAARKVFRVMRPLESVSPVLLNPQLNASKPVAIELLNKLKNVLMALYFGADHVVWASQAGLYTNKENVDKAQKISLWSWALGSVSSIISECYEIAQLSNIQQDGESQEAWDMRKLKAQTEINKRLITLIHAIIQAALAVGLLGLRPWKPRTVGLLGVAASVLNCYMLYPSLPPPVSKTTTAKAAQAVMPNSAKQQAKVDLKKA